MSLIFRLKLLTDSNVITKETRNVIENIIEMFKKKHGIELTEENAAMMITHLSMAITRVKKSEPVKQISLEVYQEILESDYLENAKIIYADIENILDVKLPEDEIKYMLVNICVILENIKK